jgi:hypothetical protein
MKFKITLLLLLVSSLSFAQTFLSGQISSNKTLLPSGNPYIITGDVTVNAGVVLTVNPGVQLYFNSGWTLNVFGKMSADSAVFTSIKDTIGGTPQSGDWNAILQYRYRHQ